MELSHIIQIVVYPVVAGLFLLAWAANRKAERAADAAAAAEERVERVGARVDTVVKEMVAQRLYIAENYAPVAYLKDVESRLGVRMDSILGAMNNHTAAFNEFVKEYYKARDSDRKGSS